MHCIFDHPTQHAFIAAVLSSNWFFPFFFLICPNLAIENVETVLNGPGWQIHFKQFLISFHVISQRRDSISLFCTRGDIWSAPRFFSPYLVSCEKNWISPCSKCQYICKEEHVQTLPSLIFPFWVLCILWSNLGSFAPLSWGMCKITFLFCLVTDQIVSLL